MQKIVKRHPATKKIIEQWEVRRRRARLEYKKIAELAKISSGQLSRIITGKAKNPRMSTIDRVERVLESKGV